MPDYQALVQCAEIEYWLQPGLIDIKVEGDPVHGLRLKFEHESYAERFMFLRSMLKKKDPSMGQLRCDGVGVVEVWGEYAAVISI